MKSSFQQINILNVQLHLVRVVWYLVNITFVVFFSGRFLRIQQILVYEFVRFLLNFWTISGLFRGFDHDISVKSVFGYFMMPGYCISLFEWYCTNVVHKLTYFPALYLRIKIIYLFTYNIHIRATCSAKCPSLYMISMRVLVHQSISVSQAQRVLIPAN